MLITILISAFLATLLLSLILLRRVRKTRPYLLSESPKNNLLPEQRSVNANPKHILFDLNLPFTPDVHDVIYVENEYDPAVNGYIKEHYEEIQQQFLSKKATFVYLPKLCGHEVPKDALHYMFPFLGQESSFVNGNLTIETLKSHILSGSIEGPALIHFVRMEAENPENYYQ